MMEMDAYESCVKKSGEMIEAFRDTTGPTKSYNHVFEATTSIGKCRLGAVARIFHFKASSVFSLLELSNINFQLVKSFVSYHQVFGRRKRTAS